MLAAAAALVIATAVSGRRARAQLLERLRREWATIQRRDHNTDALIDYHRSRTEGRGLRPLDDRTCTDLHLDQIFERIDRTGSTLGQQALYHRLRMGVVADDRDAFEALVVGMTNDQGGRERAQIVLARLRDPAGYDLWWLAQPGAIQRQPWHVLFAAASAAMLAALLLAPFWPPAFLAAVALVVINLIVRATTATRIRALVGTFRQVAPLIDAAAALRDLPGDGPNPYAATLRAEVPRLARLRKIARWVSRDALSAGELPAAIFEYLNLLFLLDVNAVYFGARDLDANGAALLRVIAAVGDVDAAIAVASFRAGAGPWVRPTLSAGNGRVMVTDARHPLVADAVPNSIQLAPPHGLLVTGSNMSGKSTFVRTLGVTAVMAQTINTCLAAAYEAPVFHVRSLIGRSDDLMAGKSSYIVEVEAVVTLVEASKSRAPHLFLFDELFRGTNAVERIAAAEAVLTELLLDNGSPRPHLVVAATHDAELIDLLSDLYAACHFEDRIGPEGLIFEHRLRPGPATTRNAIELLRLKGASTALVERALARAALLDRQRRAATGLD